MNNKGLRSSYTSKSKRYNVAIAKSFLEKFSINGFSVSDSIRRCVESYIRIYTSVCRYDAASKIAKTAMDDCFKRIMKGGRKKQVAFVLPIELSKEIDIIQEQAGLSSSEVIRAILYDMSIPF